jgi:peptide alpha-N-acetyltransferase
VGKILEHRGKSRGYVAMLTVDAAFRNRGIATCLSELLINEMRSKHVDEIVLETEDTNAASLALYERLGFARDKYLPQYYLNGSGAFRLKLWLE